MKIFWWSDLLPTAHQCTFDQGIKDDVRVTVVLLFLLLTFCPKKSWIHGHELEFAFFFLNLLPPFTVFLHSVYYIYMINKRIRYNITIQYISTQCLCGGCHIGSQSCIVSTPCVGLESTMCSLTQWQLDK